MGRAHLRRGEIKDLLKEGPSRLVMRLLEHLFSVCSECKRAFDEATGRTLVQDEPEIVPTSSSLVDDVLTRLDGGTVEQLQTEGQRDFDELMELLPGPARMVRIERARSRFQSPFLVDLLIDESKRTVTRDPFAAYELAELAHAVAMRMPHNDIGTASAMTCIARAKAYRGNALRATGNFKHAEPYLEVAVSLFFSEGTGDPLVEAELLTVLAALRHDQRRLAEAADLLTSSLSVYAEVEEPVAEATTMIELGRVYGEQGETEKAIEITRASTEKLDQDRDAKLYLCAVHNTVRWLEDAEQYEEARDILVEYTDLYSRFPEPWTQLRHAWVLGICARGLGQLDEAEMTLSSVRTSFMREDLHYDAALVGLDLAMVHVAQGKTTKLSRLADEILPIFLAQDVQRDAVTALALFQESVRRDAATEHMVKELIGYMQRVRRST